MCQCLRRRYDLRVVSLTVTLSLSMIAPDNSGIIKGGSPSPGARGYSPIPPFYRTACGAHNAEKGFGEDYLPPGRVPRAPAGDYRPLHPCIEEGAVVSNQQIQKVKVKRLAHVG